MLVIIVGDVLLPVRGLKTAKNVPKIPNIGIFCHENEVVLDELYILKITFRNGLEIGMGNFPQHFLQVFQQDFLQDFPTRISHKIFPQQFLTISCKIFPQNYPTTISHNKFPQQLPTRFSCKIFLQDFPTAFPTRFSHHLIPNTKFPPITALLNMPTYHKSAKGSPPPFPQIS